MTVFLSVAKQEQRHALPAIVDRDQCRLSWIDELVWMTSAIIRYTHSFHVIDILAHVGLILYHYAKSIPFWLSKNLALLHMHHAPVF